MRIRKLFSVLVIEAILDLMVRILPRMKKQGGFAFLVHPRSTYDAVNKYPFLKLLPKAAVDFILRRLWPITASRVDGLKSKEGRPIRGWIIGVPLTPRQMMENRELARKRIIQAAVLAAKKGARIIGLGALNASFSRGGLDVVEHFSEKNIKAGVTTGRAYTGWIVTQNAFKVMEIIGLDINRAKVAVVGAAGSIGSACVSILLKKGIKNLLLVDVKRKKEILDKLIIDGRRPSNNISILSSHSIGDIRGYDVIIAATNAPEAKIKSEDLSSGSVVIDDAQPSDVDPEIIKTRDDVLIIEGGVIHAPGINPHINLGLKHKEDIYCCLGETMALAYNDWKGNFSIGRLSFGLIDKIVNIAGDLGFRLAEFQNFHKVISYKDFEKIRGIKGL